MLLATVRERESVAMRILGARLASRWTQIRTEVMGLAAGYHSRDGCVWV